MAGFSGGLVRSARAAWDRLDLSGGMRRDMFRWPTQTVCAVALAYFLGRLILPEQVSWAVFSAIFVVQASAGGTWSSAVDRTGGAVLGSLLGCALILLCIQLGISMLPAMVLGVGVMSALSVWRPQLSYGLVTVAILTVTPQGDMLADAFEQVVAVAMGSLCAAVAGTVILPVSTRRRARKDIRDSAQALSVWLRASNAALLDEERGPIHHEQQKLDKALANAQQVLWEAPRWWRSRHRAHPRILKCREHIQGLRYSVAILDRLGWTPFAPEVRARMVGPLNALSEAAQIILMDIAEDVYGETASDALPNLEKEMQQLRAAVAESVELPGNDDRSREHIRAVAWAWGTLTRQLHRVASEQCDR